MSPAPEGCRFGIEAEYALIRPDGRFADHNNTSYEELRRLLDPLPDYRHPELRVGDAGIRVKNWYVEGDERFDAVGRSTGMAVKGIEIRTPVRASIAESLESLETLRVILQAELAAHGWALTATGFNPCTASYAPDYSEWEREFHASHAENALPEVSTLSFGPDFNFSFADCSPEQAIATARRLTWYSPWIVPFSFSAPFVDGRLWEGLSYRTWRRTGPRPAALVHLATPHAHPLVKRADPPSQHRRIEFKAFDMVADDALLGELFALAVGVALADPAALPGAADRPDPALHRKVALSGLDDESVHSESARIVAAAREALKASGFDSGLPRIEALLAARRTPAHAMRERFIRTGELFRPLP